MTTHKSTAASVLSHRALIGVGMRGHAAFGKGAVELIKDDPFVLCTWNRNLRDRNYCEENPYEI
jgi:hypothetical protein